MNILADGNLYRGKIQAQLSGTIDTLELYEYAYSNITLDGQFTNTTFNGGFSVSDPNIRMELLDILQLQLSDNTKACHLDKDHNNTPVRTGEKNNIRAQAETYKLLKT